MFVVAAIFTLASAYALGLVLFPALALARVIRLALGAVILSLIVFLELLFACATLPMFLFTGIACLAGGVWRWRVVKYPPSGPRISTLLWIPFAIYTAMYTVQAMAPEIQPDALTYHLGLTAEYARIHAFPARIGFYEMIPQGLEMLFTMAYSLGGGSAAKLVHFAFLLASVPLIMAVGRELKLGRTGSYLAALLYFVMPVAGITGTSTYNDAALVFFTLAAFHCILIWHNNRRASTLIVIGLLAGFCFGIKITGLPVVAGTAIAVLVLARRPLPFLLVTAAAMIPMAPWVLRAFIFTGNPAAPLLNAWFPNAFFNAAAEAQMAINLRSYAGFNWHDAPWEYAMRGNLQGIIGPLLFALPFALLAARKRAGQLLLLAALVALSPWFFNAGTRFLMPAIPFLTLALCSFVPVSLLLTLAAIQLLLCWPPVLQRLEGPYAWSFHSIPWRAALRMEPEAEYLQRTIGEYPIARMVEDNTAPRDRIYGLTAVATAYTTRDVAVYWYSTPDQELEEALAIAIAHEPMVQASAALAGSPITGMRVVAGADSSQEFRIFELQLSLRGERLLPGPSWKGQASPGNSEVPMAFDNNRATSWRVRSRTERGMFLSVLFREPTSLDHVDVVLPASSSSVPFLLQTQTNGGPWRTVADLLRTATLPPADLRREATRALRRAGFRFVLAHAGADGIDSISDDMVKHTAAWGLRDRAELAPVHLFEIE